MIQQSLNLNNQMERLDRQMEIVVNCAKKKTKFLQSINQPGNIQTKFSKQV